MCISQNFRVHKKMFFSKSAYALPGAGCWWSTIKLRNSTSFCLCISIELHLSRHFTTADPRKTLFKKLQFVLWHFDKGTVIPKSFSPYLYSVENLTCYVYYKEIKIIKFCSNDAVCWALRTIRTGLCWALRTNSTGFYWALNTKSIGFCCALEPKKTCASRAAQKPVLLVLRAQQTA